MKVYVTLFCVIVGSAIGTTVFCCIVISLLASHVSEDYYRNEFVKFAHTYNRVYASEEFEQKFYNFKTNLDLIEETNAANKGFTLGMNKFGDLSG